MQQFVYAVLDASELIFREKLQQQLTRKFPVSLQKRLFTALTRADLAQVAREAPARHAARFRHQVNEGVVRLGNMQVHRIHHLLGGVRPRHGQHFGMHFLDQVAAFGTGFGAQTACHDDLAVFSQGFANGV